MKITRIAASLLLLCVCFVTLYSCGSNDTLQLNSGLFTELEAKEVDVQWLQNFGYADETYCYNGPIFVLNERDGAIYLEERDYMSSSYVCNLNNRYLVGIDCGEFDGWVSVVDYGSNHFENAKEERILNKNCKGILNGQRSTEYDGEVDWRNNLDEAYIFTASLMEYNKETGRHGGYIYKFENTSGTDWKCEKFAELDSAPCAFMVDEGNIIVSTELSLCSVDTEGNVTQLYTADYWRYLRSTSIVKLDNCYYISTYSGIMKYDIDTQDIVWYPYYDEDGE